VTARSDVRQRRAALRSASTLDAQGETVTRVTAMNEQT
jgi:hypothetical protein